MRQLIKKRVERILCITLVILIAMIPIYNLDRFYTDKGSEYKFPHPEWFQNITSIPFTLYADFVINPKDMCSDSKGTLDYVIKVKTSLNNKDNRNVIRNTFGKQGYSPDIQMRLVFLVGLSNERHMSKSIVREANNHKDIIQGNFIDSYHNLAYKGAMGLRWMKTHCSNAKYVIEIDDDVLVNLYQLRKVMNDLKGKTSTIACRMREQNAPIQRGKQKWAVNYSIFPGLKKYPLAYCFGYFSMYTGDMIPNLYNAAKVTPFFWIDDIYLYGMLPATIGTVSFIDLSRQVTSYRKSFPWDGKFCKYVVILNHSKFNKTDAMRLWSDINSDKATSRSDGSQHLNERRP